MSRGDSASDGAEKSWKENKTKLESCVMNVVEEFTRLQTNVNAQSAGSESQKSIIKCMVEKYGSSLC